FPAHDGAFQESRSRHLHHDEPWHGRGFGRASSGERSEPGSVPARGCRGIVMTGAGQARIAASAIRWRIAGLLLVITTLTFIDRFNMSVASKYIQQEFRLSDVQVGALLSAFVLGYALFQIPGGILGDRFGPRRMLVWAVLWWSLFTALTAAAPGLFLAKWI